MSVLITTNAICSTGKKLKEIYQPQNVAIKWGTAGKFQREMPACFSNSKLSFVLDFAYQC